MIRAGRHLTVHRRQWDRHRYGKPKHVWKSRERELEQIKAQFDAGMIHISEFSRAEGAVRLAQIAAEIARQEQEARIKMLELDLRKTEAEWAAAGAELDALSQAHERDRNAVTEAAIRKAKAVLAEKQVELERAKTMLEFQRQRSQTT